MEELKQKVQDEFDNFSKGLKKVAKYFLANPEDFAMDSGVQVGQKINVSETTVIRFCHALGYSGFSALQKDIQTRLLNRKSTLVEYHSMKNKMDMDRDFSKKMMHKDAELILQTAEGLNEEEFNLAVERLSQSEKILVSGTRSSHAMAHWFSFALELIRGNVRMFRPDTDDIVLRIGEMNENSTFVAFSFHRYALETINMAREAKLRGAFVISFTDSEVAPIREYTDVLFTVQLPIKSTLDVSPAVFSLMNSLLGGVVVKNSDQFMKRTKAYENFHLHHFFGE
ncbi:MULTISPECIES: MurR/RpiR family transcriptional regulator [unclassified Bacillus (in: firmicutes)]|uniref:MurR/RpiR family transcriptional regulator n=1 Tax=unclassified Bacillus (in: firmicutes) TaxID=185979 RepID=UPI000BF0FFA0|nr:MULTISPECIES: MurR/RpiR family transcriptional regulator [unclassified Bacillus (in: firmicutes)]PEJ53605.1 transcriptional regulator [Bacillus sp. AFS002410]PEL11182.1 transcriptional regulator [Bacillus sp. AFS017336]